MKKKLKDFSKKALEKENKVLRKRVIELEDSWKRALADYQNLKNRIEKEKEEIIFNANKRILVEILEVFNNVEMLSNHIKDAGLEITLKHFSDVLNRLGLQEIDIEGKNFDPSVAEAIEVKEGLDNIVLNVVRKGYYYMGRVLLPARVVVGKSNNSKQQ